jgi:hypothetical protein
MRLPTVESLVRRLTGTLLASLVVAALTTSEARAGCGHYVLWKQTTSGVIEGVGLDLLGTLGERSSAARTPLDAPVQTPKPCTGALCSGAPATPVIPDPPIPPATPRWGLVEVATASPRLAVVDHSTDDRPARPIDLAAAIFHPPRATRLSFPV